MRHIRSARSWLRSHAKLLGQADLGNPFFWRPPSCVREGLHKPPGHVLGAGVIA